MVLSELLLELLLELELELLLEPLLELELLELLPMVRVVPALLVALLAAKDLASSEMLTVSPESDELELSEAVFRVLFAVFDMELRVTPLVEVPSVSVEAKLV
ncbi:hypothetical protein JCM14124_28770 [Humidesulfovibrio idahonensis]